MTDEDFNEMKAKVDEVYRILAGPMLIRTAKLERAVQEVLESLRGGPRTGDRPDTSPTERPPSGAPPRREHEGWLSDDD